MSDLPLPTIPAAKNALGDALIYWGLARRSLYRDFHRVWLQTYGPLPLPQNGPLLIYLNHSAWWDGYLMYVIHRVVLGGRFDSYLLMEERQLRAYRFFAWSGAFGINRADADESEQTLHYAVNLLRDHRRARALFIFPQGRILPNDQRPLVLYPGIARIIKQAAPLTLLPVALRYEFLGQQRPHAFIRLGPAYRPADPDDSDAVLAEVGNRLTATCDALRDDVVSGCLERYAPILRGRRGIDQRFDQFMRLFRQRTGR